MPQRSDDFSAQIMVPMVVSTIGALLLFLGLYSLFGDPLHPALASRNAVLSVLVVGGLMEAWGTIKLFRAFRKRIEGMSPR